MGNFENFIRYGFPGYLFLGTINYVLFSLGKFDSFTNQTQTIIPFIGAILLIGPIVGFIIHQIYFVYFDFLESYNKLSRSCINVIYNAFCLSTYHAVIKEKNIDKKSTIKYCFLSWKFLSTNFETDFKIDPLLITRLRNLRNYSHAFGAIVFSSIMSVFIGAVIYIIFCFDLNCIVHIPSILVFFLVLTIGSLFLFKRIEIYKTITEIEVYIVLANRDRFIGYVKELIDTYDENEKVLNFKEDYFE